MKRPQNIPALFLLVALLLICLPGRALALDPQKTFSQYVQDTWQMEQGLPDNFVNAVTQTPDGYIWLATRGGLVRFDGVRFTVWNKNNSALKSNDVITAAASSRSSEPVTACLMIRSRPLPKMPRAISGWAQIAADWRAIVTIISPSTITPNFVISSRQSVSGATAEYLSPPWAAAWLFIKMGISPRSR
jgi:hypothetical protein